MQLAAYSIEARAKIMGNSLQNPLESKDFKLREHVTYTMLGAVSFKSKAPKSEGAEPIK